MGEFRLLEPECSTFGIGAVESAFGKIRRERRTALVLVSRSPSNSAWLKAADARRVDVARKWTQ